MDVEVAHFLDAGVKDANGEYDYLYEGDTFTFTEPGEPAVVARVYVDNPTVAFLVAMSRKQAQASRLAHQAAKHLASRGAVTFRALGASGTYETWTPRELHG